MVKEVSLLLQTSALELSPVALLTLHISLFNHRTSEMHLLLPLMCYTAVCWKGLRELAGISWEWTFGILLQPWLYTTGFCLHSLEWGLWVTRGINHTWILTPGFLTATNLAFNHCQALRKGLFFGWDPFLRQQFSYVGSALNIGLRR